VKRVFHSLKPTEPRRLPLFHEKNAAQRRFVHTGTYLCAVRAETENLLVRANHKNIKLKTEH
jgi:hypothetical protein